MGSETRRALAAAGAVALGLGVAALPAHAEQRTITVTLLGGKTITIPIEVPPGTPLDQITLPTLSTPILAISDSATTVPVAAPETPQAPATTTQAAPARQTAKAKHAKRHEAKAKRQVAAATHTAAVAHKTLRHEAAAKPPTAAAPTYSFSIPGPAPIGVPNFFIDKFRIPPFLLPIYQAAGIQYGVRWEILAAINEIESDYGRNLSTSHAGAVGWMQFLPSTWKRYGMDANADHKRDPYNPVDAIFAAARYLKASGAEMNIRKALFSYNHADWYVDSVLMRARLIGGLPAELVGSLTGLTEGRFPVAATSQYAQGKHATNIFARAGAAVIAVQDGKVVGLGRRTVRLRDAYGNTYTYGHLAKVARRQLHRPKLDVVGARPRDLGARTATAKSRPLRVGSRVTAGTVLGRIHDHVRFAIRPAGKGAPLIDPKPILDGWKLLESTAIYRAAGRNPLVGKDPSIGQALLMSKAQLQHRVLDDARIDIYPGGRADIAAGQIDRRVLATLEFLTASGLKPTVSCLKTGHSYLTTSGNVSEHSSGNAVDISAINGIPILDHQGPGSITDITIRRLLTLQGTTKPHQIISLMTYQATDNTLSLPDHADHIHIGFQPQISTVLKPLQWTRLIDRLNSIENPAPAE